MSAARGRDLVGFYAGGTLYRGFANSLGQRNWHEVDSFNFDWSFYRQADQAVKTSYAGFDWDAAALAQKMAQAGERPQPLAPPPPTLPAGEDRAHLPPAGLDDAGGGPRSGGPLR